VYLPARLVYSAEAAKEKPVVCLLLSTSGIYLVSSGNGYEEPTAMLRRLRLRNFQSHKKTDIELSPGLNVFMGKSRQGKTSLAIRAPRWLMQNQPRGDAFFTFGKKTCSVTGETVSGEVVTRLRDKDANCYVINDGIPLKAVRTDVPQQVQDIFALQQLNWQMEHDGPYLLNDTAGEVVRQLNEVVKLDDIDKSLSHIASRLRSSTAELKASKALLEEEEAGLLEFAYLADMSTDLVQLEKQEKKADTLHKDAKSIDAILYDIRGLAAAFDRAKEIARLEGLLVSMEQREKEIKLLHKEIGPLKDSIEEADKAYIILDKLNKVVRLEGELRKMESEAVTIEEAEEEVDCLAELLTNIHTSKQELAALAVPGKEAVSELNLLENERRQMVEGEDCSRKLKDLLTEITKCVKEQAELQSLVKKLQKQMPKACPLCGSEMKA